MRCIARIWMAWMSQVIPITRLIELTRRRESAVGQAAAWGKFSGMLVRAPILKVPNLKGNSQFLNRMESVRPGRPRILMLLVFCINLGLQNCRLVVFASRLAFGAKLGRCMGWARLTVQGSILLRVLTIYLTSKAGNNSLQWLDLSSGAMG